MTPTMVMMMMAMSEPGIFFDTIGVSAMMATERIPTMVVGRSMDEKFSK